MNVSDAKVVMLKGEKGSNIASIEKTSSDGLVDSYTITLTDGEKHTFTVANGSSIASIKKTSSSGLTDTYTVTLTNGNTTTFNVTNGNGIVSIEKTSTNALIDTYTINYNNGNHGTFNVTNGRGITSIKKTGSSGINDTYTITYNDGTTSTYNVVNADAKELTDKFDLLEGMTTGKFVSGTPCVSGNYYIADDKLYKCIANTDGTIPVSNTSYFTETNVMTELKEMPDGEWILLGDFVTSKTNVEIPIENGIDNYKTIAFVLALNKNVPYESVVLPVKLLKQFNGARVDYYGQYYAEITYQNSNLLTGWGDSHFSHVYIYGIK